MAKRRCRNRIFLYSNVKMEIGITQKKKWKFEWEIRVNVKRKLLGLFKGHCWA